MADDTTSGCPRCGSLRLAADSNKTICEDCGEQFQSGLQELAGLFDL